MTLKKLALYLGLAAFQLTLASRSNLDIFEKQMIKGKQQNIDNVQQTQNVEMPQSRQLQELRNASQNIEYQSPIELKLFDLDQQKKYFECVAEKQFKEKQHIIVRNIYQDAKNKNSQNINQIEKLDQLCFINMISENNSYIENDQRIESSQQIIQPENISDISTYARRLDNQFQTIEIFDQVITEEYFTIQNNGNSQFLNSIQPNVKIHIKNSSFTCKNDSLSYQAMPYEVNRLSLFQIRDAVEILVEDSTFQNCYKVNQGAIFNIRNTTLKVQGATVFQNNSAFYGGVVFAINSTIIMNNATFDQNMGILGGALSFQDLINATFIHTTIYSSYAEYQGAFIHAQLLNQYLVQLEEPINPDEISLLPYYSKIEFLELLFMNNTENGNFGGALYIDNKFMDVIINGSSRVDSKAIKVNEDQGYQKNYVNFAYVTDCNIFYVNNMTATHLSNNQRYSGLFIKAYDQPVKIIITNSEISAKSGEFREMSGDEYCYIRRSNANSGTFVIVNYGSSVTSINNTFKQNDYPYGAGVFTIFGSFFHDENSTYIDINSDDSSYLYCQGCLEITMKNITMKSQVQSCGFDGSLISFYQQNGNIYIDGLYMNSMKTILINSAMIHYIDYNAIANVTLRNIASLNHQSLQTKTGFIKGYGADTYIFENIYIQYGYSVSYNEFDISYSKNLFVKNVTFMGKTQSAWSGMGVDSLAQILVSNVENVYLEDSGQTCSNYTATWQEMLAPPITINEDLFVIDTTLQAYFISITYATNVHSKNTFYKNCYNSVNYFGFTCNDCESFTDEGSIYENLSNVRSPTNLGVYKIVGNQNLNITNNTYKNIVVTSNALVNFTDSFNSFVFDQNRIQDVYSFQNGGLFNIVYLTESMQEFKFQITNSNFSNIYSQKLGPVIYFNSYYSLQEIAFVNCTISKIYTEYRGAVIFSESVNRANFIFENNVISDIIALQGGALFDFESNIANISLINSSYECLTNLTFINEAFDNAQQLNFSFGPAIKVKNSIGQFTSINSTFKHCVNSIKGSAFYFQNSSSQLIINSTFLKNQANQGSSIYCELCNLIIDNSQFINNTARSGGAIFTDNKVTIQISNLTAINNTASDIGGFICITRSDVISQEQSYVSIVDSEKIYKNFALNRGGLMYLKNIKAQLIIERNQIVQQQALVEGGAFYISEAQKVKISSCNVISSIASTGAMIYTAARDASIYLEDTLIDCQMQMSGAQLYIKDTIVMNSQRNTYKNCYNAQKSGIYILEKSNMEDVNSSYSNNYGLTGGVFILFQSKLQILNSNFTNNSANQGGVFQVSQDSFLNITSSKFDNNSATKSSGVIFLTSNSTFIIQDSSFTNNKAEEASFSEILGSNTIKYLQIVNSTFINNTASKNTMSIKYAKLKIANCSFIDNQAESQSKNIYVGMSTIEIENCVFNSSITDFQEKLSKIIEEKTVGAYLSAIYDVNLTILNSSFENGLAYQGGALQISGDSYANIYNSNFTNNAAQLLGGAIYATRYNEFNITHCEFIDNYGRDYGDDIYVQNSEYLITITQTYIKNSIGKQAIYADNALIKLIDSKIEDIQDTSADKLNLGGAALFYNCQQLDIINCEFKNISSYEGGAIYIWESEDSKDQTANYTLSQKYKMSNSTFANCSSQNGGALYLSNPQSLSIQNTTFFNNTASSQENVKTSGNGGALFYTCSSYKGLCSVEMSDNNQFILNHAGVQGGAIYWNEKEPIINQTILTQSLAQQQSIQNPGQSQMFVNNTAGQYGDIIASYPQRLAVINETIYERQLIQKGVITQDDLQRMRRQLNQANDKVHNSKRDLVDINNYQQTQVDLLESVFNQFRSGGYINTTYLAIVDKYDQIVGSDYSSVVRVFVNSTYNQNPSANIYPPIVEGTNSFNAQAGVVKLENVMFYSTPGFNQSIIILNDGISLKKESNIKLMKELNKTDLNYRLKISLRKCLMGEQFTQAGKCTECNPGYSLKNMSEPSICDECPDQKAFCHGGAFIGPKPGFWRKNYYTDTIIQCLYQPACLGMLPPNNNPKGDCFTGYQGTLCADCQNDFSRAGEFQCQRCPSNEINVVRLLFTLLGVLFLVVLMIRSTLMSAHDKTNITNIFQKILMNHFQLLMMASSFEFEWSQQLVDFFTQTKQAATVSTQIISIDCFLNRKNNEDGTLSENRVFFVKLVIIAILPLVMCIICVMTWSMIKLLGKNIDLLNRSISSIVIALFLIHPSVILYMFYNFKCKDIDGEMRIRNDLEIQCWSDQHKYYSFYFAIPSIVVWGLGIPLAVFVILFTRRQALDTFEIRQRYGFLYRGYKQSFYYWEIIVMYRKISILFVSVFISSFGVIAQALAVFAILIAFLMVNLKKQPYSTHELNNLETMSIVTSMLTIYCGMFFVLDRPKSWIDQNPDYSKGAVNLPNVVRNLFFALILLSNLIFFAYWIVKMFEQMRAKIRQNCTQVYLACFLCLNNQKLLKENEEYKILKEHQIYYEDALKFMLDFENLYKSGKLILNSQNIERLKLYLNPDKIFNFVEQIKQNKLNEPQIAEFDLNQQSVKNNLVNSQKMAEFDDMQQSKQIQLDEQKLLEKSQKRSTRAFINRKKAYLIFGEQEQYLIDSKKLEDDQKTTKSNNSQSRLNQIILNRNSLQDSGLNKQDIVEINEIAAKIEKKKVINTLKINTKIPSQMDLGSVIGSVGKRSFQISEDIELIKKPLKKSGQPIKKPKYYKRAGFT